MAGTVIKSPFLKLKILGLIGFNTLVLLLVIELVLRIFGWSDPGIYFSHCFTLDIPGEFTPGHTSMKRDGAGNPYRFSANEKGFRTTGRLISSPGKIILCLGDSYTYGVVDDDKTYPYLLQDLLRKDSIQVYNAGVSGYTMEDELSYFIDKGLATGPDLVIVAFCKNDFYDYAEFFRKSFKRHGQGAWRQQKLRVFLKRNLRLLSLIKQIKIRKLKKEVEEKAIRNIAFDINKEEFVLSQISQEELEKYRARYAGDFKELHSLCLSHDIGILPVIFPSPAQLKGIEPFEDQKFLADLFSSLRLKFLDVQPIIQEYSIDTLYIKGDGHPTDFLNQLTAEAIAGMLPL